MDDTGRSYLNAKQGVAKNIREKLTVENQLRPAVVIQEGPNHHITPRCVGLKRFACAPTRGRGSSLSLSYDNENLDPFVLLRSLPSGSIW